MKTPNLEAAVEMDRQAGLYLAALDAIHRLNVDPAITADDPAIDAAIDSRDDSMNALADAMEAHGLTWLVAHGHLFSLFRNLDPDANTDLRLAHVPTSPRLPSDADLDRLAAAFLVAERNHRAANGDTHPLADEPAFDRWSTASFAFCRAMEARGLDWWLTGGRLLYAAGWAPSGIDHFAADSGPFRSADLASLPRKGVAR